MNFYSHHASSEINVNGGANYVIRSALLLACSMAGENTNPLIIYILDAFTSVVYVWLIIS